MASAPRTCCFTSATYSYLSRARTLFSTLQEFHPDWDLVLVSVDELPEGLLFEPRSDENFRIVRYSELGIENFGDWAFAHDVVELCTAVKGPALCRFLDAGYERVIYLDPDTALFRPMQEVENLLARHPVVLTPHLLEPQHGVSIEDNEISALKHGVFNLGFLAVSNSAEGNRAARWWRDRLLSYCFDEIASGIFVDQKWWDLAPAFFPDTAILRHKGYNAACWNLFERPLSIDGRGDIRVGGDLLTFFHFTKVTTVGGPALVQHAGHSPAVLELMKWYLSELERNAVPGIPENWWYFSTFADGRPISREDRRAARVTRR